MSLGGDASLEAGKRGVLADDFSLPYQILCASPVGFKNCSQGRPTKTLRLELAKCMHPAMGWMFCHRHHGWVLQLTCSLIKRIFFIHMESESMLVQPSSTSWSLP